MLETTLRQTSQLTSPLHKCITSFQSYAMQPMQACKHIPECANSNPNFKVPVVFSQVHSKEAAATWHWGGPKCPCRDPLVCLLTSFHCTRCALTAISLPGVADMHILLMSPRKRYKHNPAKTFVSSLGLPDFHNMSHAQ